MQGDFRLGHWLVCPKLNTVQADGRAIRLEPKFMQVLVCLADRSGEVVSKEELMRAVWMDTFVTDDVLMRAISELRRVLGDDAKQPHVIETVARSGYRIIAPVQLSGEGTLPAELKSRERLSAGQRKALVAGVAVVAIAITIAVALRRRPAEVQINRPQPIAVLPLQNTSATKDLDFLRIGLADDIANTLSYYPALTMRPFAITNQYAGADVDLQKAAREMRVADIITGHFVVAGDEIEVTLEAVDATNNRVLWRDTLRGTAHDLIGIQQQIATRLQHGLIEALGVNSGPDASSNTSHNAEAYELYLRAVSEGNSTNAQIENTIRLLQRAVAVDPSYSSAWARLGHFYYYKSGFGDVDKASRLRAKAALQRAVALDSGRIDAASDLITMESEEGELNRAYDDITELLHRRPDSATVHLVYSYVLWYGGLLNDAASECEKARSLDAGTTDLPSCGYVFMALGRYERAREYLQLYSGSEYERSGKVEIFLREGKQNEALQELKALPATVENGRQMLEPCLQHRPRTKAEAVAVQQLHPGVMAVDDPFPKYSLAAWDSLCDQPDLAFRELHRAIEQNYCAYPQMETDPLLEKLRVMPQFAEIRSLGIACQQHFLEHKNRTEFK
jgi:DNA-binding winged helix-turn-helix (wHTH) protein/TolB-like protein